jgi:hypothetical protein
MKSLILFLLPVLLSFSCSNKISPDNSSGLPADAATTPVVATVGAIPTCIQQKIDSIKSQPVWNPPAEIHEYEYKGQRMFALSAPCCDFFNTVVDENCNYICAPSGGFTGKGDGKCTDFFKVGKHIKLVWKDERARK